MRSFDQRKQLYLRCGPDAYWIVGVGLTLRHATEFRPGTFPAGEWIPTLCGRWFKVPFSTPYGREPQSKSISDKCPQCTELVQNNEYSSTNWDF